MQQIKKLIYGNSIYLKPIDEIKNELYERISKDYYKLRESSIDDSTIKSTLISDKRYTYFYSLYKHVQTIAELNSKIDELEKQNEPRNATMPEPEIPGNMKLRHSILIMYELGIIEYLETELKKRGIKLDQQNRNYLPNLLSIIMNAKDRSTQETIRKEISQHPSIKTPTNVLNKILANFSLQVNNLK